MFTIYEGISVFWGILGLWTKCHDIFINTVKQRFTSVNKNAMAYLQFSKNPQKHESSTDPQLKHFGKLKRYIVNW